MGQDVTAPPFSPGVAPDHGLTDDDRKLDDGGILPDVDTQTKKRFNLIDAMVLVAATAAGFALGRALTPQQRSSFETVNEAVANYVVSVALMWTLAILALNFTRYRTTIRDLACRPGFTALVAIVVDWFSETIHWAILSCIGPPYTLGGSPHSLGALPGWLWDVFSKDVEYVMYSQSCAGAVSAVWIVTAMAGCWRAEKTWIDRTGRAFGVFWLLVVAAYWLSILVFPAPSVPTSLGP
jgi:hypothetical protein